MADLRKKLIKYGMQDFKTDLIILKMIKVNFKKKKLTKEM